MSQDKTLVLVDGSSYLFRAYHALPPFTNHQGEPTGALYGVVNMVRKLQEAYPTQHFVMVFDAKGKTFRNDLYADYKANRPPMPDDLRVQIEPLHAIIRAMGLPLLCVPGVEADDVIGTLAKRASAQAMPVVISTGDKDMAQLVDEHVTLINTMTDVRMDKDGVVEKFGVPPEQIIDYLALVGDKVDNIPGVEKCGPKTAVKWLNQHGSLNGVMESAPAMKGKIGEHLRNALEHLPLSYELATIKTDVELEQSIEELVIGDADSGALAAYFERFEFKTWLRELQSDGEETEEDAEAAPPEAQYETILTTEQLDAWIAQLEAAELFAFDTETTSLDYMEAEVVGLCFATEPGVAAYLPLAHDYPDAPEQLDRESTLARLKPLLESEQRRKVGQNLKYDKSVLANHGITLGGIAHDTMLESYVCDSTATRHDMDSLAKKYLDYDTVHFEDIAGKGKKQLTFNQIELEAAAHYAAEDADITLRLHQTLWPKLEAEPRLKQLYEDVELPLLSVLSDVERTGVSIDVDMLRQQSQELAVKMKAVETEAFEEAEESFNLNSPKQIQEIFFTKKQFPIIRKTPKGQPSTAEDVLEQLAHEYRLPSLILQYRSLSKLKSTYTDKLPEQCHRRTGRVHTSYHQAVASTGRLSSSDPNLQNIPVRTQEGRRIRQAFVVPEGKLMLAADYSQIELRIMAHLSDDEGLLSAFRAGLDIHSATAAEVFATAPDQVQADQRRAAKAINFGLIYGMSAFGLAKQLEVSRASAQDYIDLYFSRYPGVKTYMDDTRELAKAQGYVETVFGRRLYLPDINNRNVQRRQYAERSAINAPMQGTAADIIKRAMIDVQRWLVDDDIPARIVMQVHDELVLEADAEQAETIADALKTRMSAAAELKVPLLVECGIANNWEGAH